MTTEQGGVNSPGGQGGVHSPGGQSGGALPAEQQIDRLERLAERLEVASRRRQPSLLWWISILTAANLVSAALLYWLSMGIEWVATHGEQAGTGLADFIIGVLASAACTSILYAVQRVRQHNNETD